MGENALIDAAAVDLLVRIGVWAAVSLGAGGVGAVLGVLVFGRGYKRRIAALEAKLAEPAITQVINIDGKAPDQERELGNAIDAATAQGLKETIRGLTQHPLDGGHTYANLPDGTNIVWMADGTMRLALPVNLSTSFRAGTPKVSVSPSND